MPSKRTIHIALTAIFCMAFWGLARAQEPLLKATLDRDSILIGDHVTLSLTIKKEGIQQVGFPIFNDTVPPFPGIELVKDIPLDTISKEGMTVLLEKKYIITSYDSARYFFSIPCLMQNRNTTDTLVSNRVELYVNTIPIDTATYKAFDIKGPIEYPYTLKEFIPFILMGLAALLLIALAIYFWVRYRKNQPIFFKPKKVDPPYVVAVRELKKLKEEKAWQQEQPKQYYTRLTDIFRMYVENSFGIPMMEKTSQEILDEYKQSPLAEKYPIDKLNEFFHLSDLAKFAKYHPTIAESERSFVVVYEFVEASKPDVPQEAASNDGEGSDTAAEQHEAVKKDTNEHPEQQL